MIRWPGRKVWQTSGMTYSIFVALARREWLGLGEAVAELAADRLAAHQLLIAAHVDAFRVRRWIGIIVRVDVDQFDDEIGIRAGGGYAQDRRDRARDGDVVIRAARSDRPARRDVGMRSAGRKSCSRLACQGRARRSPELAWRDR